MKNETEDLFAEDREKIKLDKSGESKLDPKYIETLSPEIRVKILTNAGYFAEQGFDVWIKKSEKSWRGADDEIYFKQYIALLEVLLNSD